MNTTSYTDNSIFANEQLNAICDLIFSKLVEQFPPVDPDTDNDFVYESFILSGFGSKILQRPEVEDLKNVIFQCDNGYIYEWFALNYQKIFNCQGMIYKERILIYPFGYYFEIWFSETPLNAVVSSGINVQYVDDIPTILL